MTDKITGVTPEGREWSIGSARPAGECYPKTDSYTWGAFAGLAIELGGYNDLEAVDPYTGRRFWLASALHCDAHAAELHAATPGAEAMAVYGRTHECGDCHGSLITAMRRLFDAMEAAGFPDDHRDSDQGVGRRVALDTGERNLIVSGLNRLLAEPVDALVNPPRLQDTIRALRDKVTNG